MAASLCSSDRWALGGLPQEGSCAPFEVSHPGSLRVCWSPLPQQAFSLLFSFAFVSAFVSEYSLIQSFVC
jgi:hypothetical protein